MKHLYVILICWFIGFSLSSRSIAGIGQYFSEYNLGFNHIGSQDSARVTFKPVQENTNDPFCHQDSAETLCTVHLGSSSKGLGSGYLKGFGIFLEKPFKRQGFWHFDYDISYAANFYSASASQEINLVNNSLLRSISYTLLGGSIRPYIQFGITPAKLWPDLLITFGPNIMALMGQTEVNGKERLSMIASSSELFAGINPFGYANLMFEAVFYRFGTGFFSFYTSRNSGGNTESLGAFYPGEVDGLRDFEAKFWSQEGGFKLLLNTK